MSFGRQRWISQGAVTLLSAPFSKHDIKEANREQSVLMCASEQWARMDVWAEDSSTQCSAVHNAYVLPFLRTDADGSEVSLGSDESISEDFLEFTQS